VSSAAMWLSMSFSMSPRIDIELRLQAAAGISTLPADIKRLQRNALESISQGLIDGVPANPTLLQVALLLATRAMTGLESLERLLRWLDTEAAQKIRADFDAMLEWPVVQASGAFVHTAWAATHETTED